MTNTVYTGIEYKELQTRFLKTIEKIENSLGKNELEVCFLVVNKLNGELKTVTKMEKVLDLYLEPELLVVPIEKKLTPTQKVNILNIILQFNYLKEVTEIIRSRVKYSKWRQKYVLYNIETGNISVVPIESIEPAFLRKNHLIYMPLRTRIVENVHLIVGIKKITEYVTREILNGGVRWN